MLILSFALPFTVGVGLRVVVLFGVAGRVLHLAHEFLRLAFDLLRGALGLGVGVPRPFSDLTLHSSCRIVHCALYAILVHHSTSVGITLWVWGLFRCASCEALQSRRKSLHIS